MAAFFTQGLTRGFIDPAVVTTWVDGVIVDSAQAEDWMLDLSTEEDPKQMLHHLYRVPGEVEEGTLAHLLFEALKLQFERNGDVQQAIHGVFDLAHHRGLPEHKVAEAYQIDHEADHGFERPEREAELNRMLREFFATYETKRPIQPLVPTPGNRP